MNAAPLAILGASLLGSVHCAAMCGGFVCFYTGTTAGQPTQTRTMHTHVMYNVGRLLSYATLGATAGALGAHITHLSALAGIARGAAIVSGSLLIIWAISDLLARSGSRMFAGARSPSVPIVWQRAAGAVLLRIRQQPLGLRAFTTGVLTGALPCGWLYVFVAAAGGAGSALGGVMSMTVFWLGTLPALVAVGLGAQRLLVPFRERLPQLSAAVVLITGILTVSGRLVFTHVH